MGFVFFATPSLPTPTPPASLPLTRAVARASVARSSNRPAAPPLVCEPGQARFDRVVCKPRRLRYVGRGPLPPLEDDGADAADVEDEEEEQRCDRCEGSGFVACVRCGASGKIRGEVYTLFCDDCVGHGKLRCPACGGKCYMCD